MSDEPFEYDDHSETEGLTADTQVLYRRLVDDGAVWRAESHSIQDLGAQLQRQAAALGAPPEAASRTRPVQVHILDHLSRSRSLIKGASSMPHGRIGRFAAVLATLAISGALAAVILTMVPGHHRISPHSSGGSGSGSEQHGVWVDLSKLDYNTNFTLNDLPAMAPSDPRVVYEALVKNIYEGGPVQPAQLRRTDDEGASWHTLPVPISADHVGDARMVVSPLNAHVVFLTLLEISATDCPADQPQPNTEAGGGRASRAGSMCWLQYTSTDGGADWTPTKLPLVGGHLAGFLAGPTFGSAAGIIVSDARGSHLYAGFTCVDLSCDRLITSADGGATWQFADQPLMASARDVCDYTAAPTDTTLYAVTTPNKCFSPYDQVTLWRSDDAGAHWTSLGNLATHGERGIMLVNDPRSGVPLLYMALPQPQTTSFATDKMGHKYPLISAAPDAVKVSADGGRTWTAAPSQGIPAGQVPWFARGLTGVLPDGSVVVEFIPLAAQADVCGSTLYAWKRGDAAWRQLAPPITDEVGSMLVTSSNSGDLGAIWLVLMNPCGQLSHTFTFMRDSISDG
jgi:hypothetical protein